jgi:hypothetical protein
MRGALLLLFAAACAPEEIVIATAVDPKPPCTSNDDCGADEHCAKAACGDRTGKCERRPVNCGAELREVCGCDGVQYWNDCLRRASGVESFTPGLCGPSARMCGGPRGETCPGDAFCARVFPPGMCPPREAPGRCWLVPADCSALPGDRFSSCAPGGPACVDLCAAIKSEIPHVRQLRCP